MFWQNVRHCLITSDSVDTFDQIWCHVLNVRSWRTDSVESLKIAYSWDLGGSDKIHRWRLLEQWLSLCKYWTLKTSILLAINLLKLLSKTLLIRQWLDDWVYDIRYVVNGMITIFEVLLLSGHLIYKSPWSYNIGAWLKNIILWQNWVMELLALWQLL